MHEKQLTNSQKVFKLNLTNFLNKLFKQNTTAKIKTLFNFFKKYFNYIH